MRSSISSSSVSSDIGEDEVEEGGGAGGISCCGRGGLPVADVLACLGLANMGKAAFDEIYRDGADGETRAATVGRIGGGTGGRIGGGTGGVTVSGTVSGTVGRTGGRTGGGTDIAGGVRAVVCTIEVIVGPNNGENSVCALHHDIVSIWTDKNTRPISSSKIGMR